MKQKLCAALTAMFVISMTIASAAAYVPPYTPPYTWVYVEDYEFVDEADLTGTEFNVTVNVYNVTYLGAWEYKLGYNTTLLDAIWVYKTPITEICTDWGPLDPDTMIWTPTSGINDTIGQIWSGALFPPGQEFDGDGALVTITFRITLAPPLEAYLTPQNRTVSCDLHLYDVVLGDGMGATIEVGTDDGSYAYIRPQLVVGYPTANFTWTPPSPRVGDTVTFDASASKTGDSVIVSYAWDFDSNVNPGVDKIEGPITTWVYTATGTYEVILNVTNTEGYSHDLTQSVVVVKKPLSEVDVFTIKSWLGRDTKYRERGTGVLPYGSAFAPGETVTLRGVVRYEGVPVIAVNEGFQVNNPDPYTSRTAATDIDGNATISFMLPLTPKEGPYGVVATARVFELDMNDTLTFEVGQIITVSVTAPTEPVARGSTATFTLTVTNIDPYPEDAYPVLLTISVSDWIGVVLGMNDTGVIYITSGVSSPIELSVYIPTTAIPGYGAEVEANAYTDWPAAGGSAYCPKATDTFTITL